MYSYYLLNKKISMYLGEQGKVVAGDLGRA